MSTNTNRQPAGTPTGGQFAAGSSPEASAVDLSSAERSRAEQHLADFEDRILADHPEARTLIIEENEMGAWCHVADLDDQQIELDADEQDEYDEMAEEMMGHGMLPDRMDTGPVDPISGASTNTIRIGRRHS